MASCSESLSSDQTSNPRPPASFRQRWRQRKRDPTTENRIRPQSSRSGDRELDPATYFPIRRQRAGSGHRTPSLATKLPIRRQRAGSRHRAPDPVTESRISLCPTGPVCGFSTGKPTPVCVGFLAVSPFLVAGPPFLVAGSLFLCRHLCQ